MELYNTYSRKIEHFKPIKDKKVGMYTCGPTVYNYAHIGNLRTYVFEDLLKRWLIYNGYKVSHVMNITDVGHLTSDEDEGEDKMEKGAKREGKSVEEIAEFYTNAFKNDLKTLKIIEPNIWRKATEHIKDMIELIKRIENNGYTYIAGGNVYFDTQKFKEYGKMAQLNLKDECQARVKKDPNKKNPRAFVLWFTNSKFENHIMQWDSPWGKGYPGWHIECSAMSMKYLGEHFDIHCGGMDHIPIHHPNEIAQSESATGHKWVNVWMHSNFLVIDSGDKMAKSGENFLTLAKVMEKTGVSGEDIRYYLMSAHYRQELKYNTSSVQAAQNAVDKINNFINKLQNIDKSGSVNEKVKSMLNENLKGFEDAMDNDLNVPLALPYLFEIMNNINSMKEKITKKDAEMVLETLNKINEVLAVMNFKHDEIPKDIEKLLEQRNEARDNKDWKKSDELRDKIQDKGFVVIDDKEKSYVKKV